MKHIIAIAIVLLIAPVTYAYVVRNWVDYAQIGIIENATKSDRLEIYKFQDASSTCYVLLGTQTHQQSLSCK